MWHLSVLLNEGAVNMDEETSELSQITKVLEEMVADPMGQLLVAFLLGMAFTVSFQIFFLWHYYKRAPSQPPPKWQYKPVIMPEFLSQILKNQLKSDLKQTESCMWLNFLAHYLFLELKDQARIRRYLVKKICYQLELILKSRSGVFIDELILRDLNLGDKIPIVSSVQVDKCEVKGDIIQNLALKCQLAYDGGLEISVDAALPFNRMACLCIKILRLRGNIRLMFTQAPYSHWSIAFRDEPDLELDVSAQLGGKNMTKLKSIMVGQIKKIIRRNHTLPNYKVRYEPFFARPDPIRNPLSGRVKIGGSEIGRGILSITVVGASRLPYVVKGGKMYCTLSVDVLPWRQKMADKRRRKREIMTLNLENKKEESLGIVLKDDFLSDRLTQAVVVERVYPGSQGQQMGLKKDDVILVINFTTVTSTKQATKIIKACKDRLQLQVDRELAPENQPSTSAWAEAVMNVDSEDEITGSQTKETQRVKSSEDPKWDETLVFQVTASTVYLNICLWSSGGEPPDALTPKRTGHDMLLGYATIDLDDIFLNCLLTTNGCSSQQLMLKHGHYKTRPELAAQYMRLAGWDPTMMYGDVFLHFHFLPADMTTQQQATIIHSNESVEQEGSVHNDFKHHRSSSDRRKGQVVQGNHQFQSTTFIKATFCEYCGKKVWMKIAFKCQKCYMVCHQKCLVNCLIKTVCTQEGARIRENPEERWTTSHNYMVNRDEEPPLLTAPKPGRFRSFLDHFSRTKNKDIGEEQLASIVRQLDQYYTQDVQEN